MKIILLSGKPNSGKSTALNLLYDKIIASKNCQILSEKYPSNSFDFECIVKYNNKTVAIKTAGDCYHWCIEAIVKYANSDIVVLAYSDKFASALNKIVGKYGYHCVVQKKRPNDIDNERVCKDIMTQI
jgi:tRNA uridine 5-carbamoylmethylation protein Kti12